MCLFRLPKVFYGCVPAAFGWYTAAAQNKAKKKKNKIPNWHTACQRLQPISPVFWMLFVFLLCRFKQTSSIRENMGTLRQACTRARAQSSPPTHLPLWGRVSLSSSMDAVKGGALHSPAGELTGWGGETVRWRRRSKWVQARRRGECRDDWKENMSNVSNMFSTLRDPRAVYSPPCIFFCFFLLESLHFISKFVFQLTRKKKLIKYANVITVVFLFSCWRQWMVVATALLPLFILL